MRPSHQWYHRLGHLFEPTPDYYLTITIDETKLTVEETEVSVWAAVDVDTFENTHIEVSPGRSDLNALLFIKQVLERCRGEPMILLIVVRGTTGRSTTSISPVGHGEKGEERSLVEAWFDLLKYRTRLFFRRFPTISPGSR